MSDNIKKDAYILITDEIKALEKSPGISLFNFVGHYNSPETNDVNNFAYRTPAAFIQMFAINWDRTQHETPAQNVTREQYGTLRFRVHIFIHDLRTDSDSYLAHLDLAQKVYRALIGLRSGTNIEGKVSSIKRISEQDHTNFENLRHWIADYEAQVIEPGVYANRIDAQPVEVEINTEIQ